MNCLTQPFDFKHFIQSAHVLGWEADQETGNDTEKTKENKTETTLSKQIFALNYF